MSDSLEKKLISVFAEAWSETAPEILNNSSMLGLLALREVKGDEVKSALAVAVTWSASFASACSGALPGVLVCLFKGEDCEEIERRAKQKISAGDGKPKPGSRMLVNSVLSAVTTRLGSESAVKFDAPQFMDLSADESKLSAVIGDAAWFGTFSLTLGIDTTTQALLLYAPYGSLAAIAPKSPSTPAPSATQSAASQAASQTPANVSTSPSSRRQQRREDPRNIDRLLDVELEIIVRFGVTNVPLREMVRMGNGSMIELDRAVDEPVELLVNGRHLARGSVVVVDGYYGVRITEIGEAEDRPISLIKGD